jgi:TPR repeat protein
VQYFKDAADGNILEAKYKYALMIRSGDGIERNHDESNKALEICGDLGDKEMQYDVAITFFLNDHPPDTLRPEVTAQDLSLCHKYLKLAADSGHSRACGFLATLQSLEYGIAQDIDQCLKYAKFAADSGDALGQAMTAFLMFARNENACAERYLQQFTESADLTILQLMSDLCLKSIRSPFNPRMGIICTIAANDRGISEASTLLSTLARQINVSEDDPDWKQKILQAVDEGDPKFWVWLGNHAFDSGAKTIGIHCMLQALAKGNLEAQTVITTRALHSDFTRSELVDLAPRVEELAAAGVTRAQELYGLFLLFGWGLRQNMVRAIGYFKMAEGENSALGQWMCGIGAFYGIGMRKDIEAAKCFLRRASRTIGEARFLLVRILIDETKLIDLLKARYSAGKCDDDCEISPDIQEAIDQIRLFADSENNPYLTYVFGFCLELGFGVTRDPEKAFECYDVAAQTVPEAEYRRSLCYRDAVGVPRNLSTAISHLREAANMGQSDAQWDLAVCLALGIGGKLDEVESLKYLRNSVEGGNVNAGLAVIGIRANFAEKYRGMVFRLAKVIPPPADERPSLYDRRLNSDGDEVGSIAGYWTGWTQFLKFSTHC